MEKDLIMTKLVSSTFEEHKTYIETIKPNVDYKPESEVIIFWSNLEKMIFRKIVRDFS